MFEQDYIMRQIKEMIQAIFKMLFGIDVKSPLTEFLESKEDVELLERLFEMADSGKINEAEKSLYDSMNGSMNSLKTALLFYSYLNDKTDEFLEENSFDREEIKAGIIVIMNKYNLNDLARFFYQTNNFKV